MKKYLLSLLFVCAGFISFCNAEFFLGDNSTRISLSSSTPYNSSCGGLCCFSSNNSNGSYRSNAMITFNNNSYSLLTGTSAYNISCFNILGSYTLSSSSSNSIYVYPYDFSSLLSSSSCPSQYTEEECKSEYNLVSSLSLLSCQGDLSSCNSSLSGCQSNLSGCMTNLDNYSTSLNTCSTNLNDCNTSLSSCMSSNCPTNSGSVSWSSLFVNGIQHLGAPIIRVNIPEEISWDYLSTTEDFILDVEGYNQDTEYIESVLEVQNYTPTREDFYNTFMLFKSFSGLIVACLFVILVFYFVKKIFK